jgi:hypothetical protein
MASKTVFISSTYKDLLQHRRAVWEVLTKFDVNVRGMEQFGARTSGPLETCLAEVGQSDVYVGIIAFRLGSIDAESHQSFTELEYEHAVTLKKDILIYLADEDTAIFPFSALDTDSKRKAQLLSFKKRLRDQHTVDKFSTAEDLAGKLKRDFQRYFEPREPSPPDDSANEFEKAARALREFRLTPKRFNGTEVRLSVAFNYGPFAASRDLCRQFNLEYGSTVGIQIRITKPDDQIAAAGFTELYATGNRVDTLRNMKAEKSGDLYATLLFCEEDIKNIQAEFLGRSYYPEDGYEPDDGSVYIPPEGKIIMLFTKPA